MTPLSQMCVNVQEIHDRLNNTTEKYVMIVTMMSSEKIGDRDEFHELVVNLLCFADWSLNLIADPGEKVILCYMKPYSYEEDM